MRRMFMMGSALILGGGFLTLSGCESMNTPSGPGARQANASESAHYAPGTGVGSSSFDRHPRFYTGPNSEEQAPPATQPAAR